jgi:MerR family transcriptional regulator, copper efflux regulator
MSVFIDQSHHHQRLTIGKLAAAAGVGVETVRFYEREGLLEQPKRTLGSSYRHYPAEALRRIEFICRAKALGFTLHEIRELLSLRSRPGAPCKTVREHALSKRDQIDAKIRELSDLRAAVDELVKVCTGAVAAGQCSILGALDGKVDQKEEDRRSKPTLPPKKKQRKSS